jgi:hypothetical protein
LRIFLRLVAIFVGLTVVLTLAWVVKFTLVGGLTALARSGVLGVETIGGWLIILTVGPVASVQLWRLRRWGLFLTALLCTLAFSYYLLGLFFLRAPGAPLTPILEAATVNGVLLALLLSPAARKACA